MSSLLMFTVAAIGFSWSWYSTRSAGEKKLALAMQELEAREPGWRQLIQTRNQTLAPAEKNSVLIALACVNSFPPEMERWCTQIEMPPSEVKSCHLDPPEWIEDLKMNLIPHREKIERLKTLTNTEPNSGFPIDFNDTNPLETLLPGRQELRRAVQLIKLENRMQLQENHPDESVRCCRAIVGVSRAIGDEPLLICQLVRMAQDKNAIVETEKTLGCCEPKQGLAELQNELTLEIESNFTLAGLKGERQTFDVLFQSLDEGRTDWTTIERKSDSKRSFFSIEGILWANYRRYMPGQRAELIELYNQMTAAAIAPFPERNWRFEDLENSVKEKTGYHQVLIRLLTPSFQKISEAEKKVKTQLSCAICAIACERFRLKNQRWPKDLNEIPKEILPAVPNDCDFGEPLKFHRTNTGIVITNQYGDDFNDYQEGENNWTFTGFRLYDPQFRRQKAKLLTPPKLDDEVDRN